MKTIELNWSIKDLTETEIPNAEANKLLANTLISEKKGDAVKLFDWALTLTKEGVITVDESDFNKIKDIIENSDTLAILSKAQFLKYFATLK